MDGSRGSGKIRGAAVTRASGTSAQKTLPHAKCSSSRPPTTGPAATPMPTTAPQTPSAAARSRRSRNVLLMIDSVVGKMTAADMPIATRAAISAPDESTRAPTVLAAGEGQQAQDQRRPAAEAVGQAARRQDQGGEGEVVAVDDPLE